MLPENNQPQNLPFIASRNTPKKLIFLCIHPIPPGLFDPVLAKPKSAYGPSMRLKISNLRKIENSLGHDGGFQLADAQVPQRGRGNGREERVCQQVLQRRQLERPQLVHPL